MFLSKQIPYLKPRTLQDQYVRMSASKTIKMLKMSLMSRNIKKQIQAINDILKIIKSKDNAVTVQVLIGCDIPGLLCDVMNNHDPQLIMKVFICMLELSKDIEFYSQKHSTVVIETTCRTLRILASVDNDNNNPTTYKGIELLGKILSRCAREAALNKSSVLAVISDILKSSRFHGLHLAAMSLLKYILQAKDFDQKELPNLVYISLTLLYKLRKNNVKRFNKHISLITQIMTYSLRYFSSYKDIPLSQKTINVIWSLVKSSVVPYVKELDVNECDVSLVIKELKCILAVFNFLDKKKLHFFSHYLAEEGYLTHLPNLVHHFDNKTVHNCVSALLYHILVRLAKSELKLPASCQLIGLGLRSLPADSTMWPELLAEAQPQFIHQTIILYFYFVFLCYYDDSVTKSSVLFPALCKYLLSQRCTPSSVILKAVSFIFAVLSLFSSQRVKLRNKGLVLATRKLVHWLKCTTSGSVFTQHPVMLRWFFSDQVNDNILRINCMVLWLQDESPASRKMIEYFVRKKDKAALCLLDVIRSCSEKLLYGAMSLVKNILARELIKKKSNMSIHVWRNLSSTLSCLTTPGWEKRLKNMCCVIFLGCKGVPQSPEISLMLRLTQQLVLIFQTICGKTWEDTLNNTQSTEIQLLLTQLFKLTHIIIYKMNRAKDFRGMKIFLEENALRRGLLACLSSDTKMVVHPALRLLAYLYQCQRQYNIQIKNRGTIMGSEFLLKLMSTGMAETAFLTANLFSIMRTFDPKYFITLPNRMTTCTIHTLYLGFLNLSVRHDVTSSLSWKCESLLLLHCHRHDPETGESLLYNPLNRLALKMAFNKNGGIKNIHLAQYLKTFVMGVKKYKLVHKGSYARALYRDEVSNILTLAGDQLATRDWPSPSVQSWLIQQICTIGGNIPSETIDALKLKVIQSNKSKPQ